MSWMLGALVCWDLINGFSEEETLLLSFFILSVISSISPLFRIIISEICVLLVIYILFLQICHQFD